jgi:hypothetical protein
VNLLKIIPAALLLLPLTACGLTDHVQSAKQSEPCKEQSVLLEKINVETAAKRADMDLQAQRNDRDIRLKIIDRCIAKDGIPFTQYPNIQCFIPPKK